MARRRKITTKRTDVRNINFRIVGKENCILYDNFITEFKVANVAKPKNSKQYLNHIFQDLILNFIQKKEAEDKQALIYSIVKPNIEKAIKKSFEDFWVVILKNLNEFHDENSAIAQMLSYVLRGMKRIKYTNAEGKEAGIVDSELVETGQTKGVELLPWIKNRFKS